MPLSHTETGLLVSVADELYSFFGWNYANIQYLSKVEGRNGSFNFSPREKCSKKQQLKTGKKMLVI